MLTLRMFDACNSAVPTQGAALLLHAVAVAVAVATTTDAATHHTAIACTCARRVDPARQAGDMGASRLAWRPSVDI